MNIAIIPARKSSKRIKNKNIKIFLNKPIIEYPIECALKSKLFDLVVVSTDCKKIKKIAEKAGAKVPFLRHKNLSGDHVSTRPVIIDAIDKIEKIYNKVENVCCIYPTSVFITSKDLKNAYTMLKKNNDNYIFSATRYKHPLERSFFIKKNIIIPFLKKSLKTRTQDFQDIYHDVGQFYLASARSLRSGINIFSKKAQPIIFSKSKVTDIDTKEDWKEAELKFSILKKK